LHADLSVDECIAMMRHVCQKDSDGYGWSFSLSEGKAWVVAALCAHGEVYGESAEHLNLTAAFRDALTKFIERHTP
jgi:hypothetical protein